MMRARVAWVSGLVLGAHLGVAGADPELVSDPLPIPPVRSAGASAPLRLPVVPSFELPASEDGAHDVRELRVRGRGLLGTELTVRGYVTWIYDCLKALAKPGVAPEETRLLMDDNPQLCERPKFYLGTTPRLSTETALWVVDVPRRANKREQIALNRAQLEMRPPVPRVAVGDFVAVTGTFAQESPHGEQSSDGLLVYKKLQHLTPSAPTTVRAIAPTSAIITSDGPVMRGNPLRLMTSVVHRNDSIESYERCNQALLDHQDEVAITECHRALASWSGNHLAWYALGNARAARDEWSAARDAYDQAVMLRPDSAMYQLYDGIASYEVAVRQARADQAPPQRAGADPLTAFRVLRQDRTGTGVVFKPYRLASALCMAAPDASESLNRARGALSTALSLAPQLSLASYYLGRTEREQDHARLAAEAFARSISADPTQADPYIALIELYRAWDFHPESLVVALQAISHVTSGRIAKVWYELGMAYESNHHSAEALEAFGNAIAAGDASASFQRGQILFRAGDFANAKRDLEAFLASRDPSTGLAKQIARTLWAEASRDRSADGHYMRVPRHIQGSQDEDR